MQKVKLYKRAKNYFYARKRLAIFSCLFFILINIVPLIDFGSVGRFTRECATYWMTPTKDFGKLKFVDGQDNSSVPVGSDKTIEFTSPFSASVMEIMPSGECKIVGASDLFKSIASGNVLNVSVSGKEKIITIDHGDGFKSIYQFEGLFCVKNGDRVEDDFIGIARKKSIILTLTKNDEIVPVLKIENDRLQVAL